MTFPSVIIGLPEIPALGVEKQKNLSQRGSGAGNLSD